MKIGFFAGSFDPPTLGHLDIIKRASALCDHLIIGIGTHAQKKPLFLAEERTKMLQEITQSLTNVEVISFNGLLVEAALKAGATSLIRGLRSSAEFPYEQEMATANRKLGRMETCFLLTRPEFSQISATLIRERASRGKRLSGLCPESIEKSLFKKLGKSPS